MGLTKRTGGPDRGDRAGMTKGLQNPGLLPCWGTRFRPVIPDIFNPPSVIPDVFNRESRVFSHAGPAEEGTEEQDTGFPLTTGGNDRGVPAGLTGGTGGNDRGGRAGLWAVVSGRHSPYSGIRQVLAA